MTASEERPTKSSDPSKEQSHIFKAFQGNHRDSRVQCPDSCSGNDECVGAGIWCNPRLKELRISNKYASIWSVGCKSRSSSFITHLPSTGLVLQSP
ncbi:hypothetical protein Y1Q_0000582 [Alligator mississippiensis]|uniref:Uncharacterized protein n=1 Tax=Alligator mississippiensis TaxID=8496 RepID=A0A151MBL8_ALLMI|nr:hypothetical protein Y1Q_0000582 [Alligator mississippiensis]